MTRPSPKKLGRRELGRSLLALAAVAACGPPPRTAKPSLGRVTRVTLWSWFDLPRADPRSRELSGITWDAALGRLWAVQDETRDLVSLVPDPGLRKWSFGASIPIASELAEDLEGIARVPEGFAVASEAGTRILEVDRDGLVTRELPLPTELAEARHNKGLESLAATPDGSALFTVTEQPLPRDEPRRHRIVRIDRKTLAATEYTYTSDPPAHGHDHGIADLAAIGDRDLLVLERGWAPEHGNTVRIYRVRLGAPGKTLVVDLADLPTKGLGLPPTRQPQATPLLDNFEGLALGPRLPDGRASLILVSDDNAKAEQVARVLVLGWSMI